MFALYICPPFVSLELFVVVFLVCFLQKFSHFHRSRDWKVQVHGAGLSCFVNN